MFHIGHLNILKNAKTYCEFLIVGVSTDELVEQYKNKRPIIPFEERCAIIEAIKFVDKVVVQDSMDKLSALDKYNFDVVFVGSDWQGTDKWNKIEEDFNNKGVSVVYLPHTDGISSTILRDKI